MSTLSPGGKSLFYNLETHRSPNINEISNPFIEKSDIVNHKKRQQIIDQQKEIILNNYKQKQIKTFAQYNDELKEKREKYFTQKMYEVENKKEQYKKMFAEK